MSGFFCLTLNEDSSCMHRIDREGHEGTVACARTRAIGRDNHRQGVCVDRVRKSDTCSTDSFGSRVRPN